MERGPGFATWAMRDGSTFRGVMGESFEVSWVAGSDRGLGVVGVNACLGFRRLGRPNGPPSRPGGVDSHHGSLGEERVWGVLIVNALPCFRRRLSPNGPPSRPARAGGLLCVNARGIRVREGWPVPIEPALGNRAQPTNPLRGSVPVAKLGFPRASEGQAGTDPPEADWSHSERPARWHGPPRARESSALLTDTGHGVTGLQVRVKPW
jgi:hypothetical protein